jgi:hypothetical protein
MDYRTINSGIIGHTDFSVITRAAASLAAAGPQSLHCMHQSPYHTVLFRAALKIP